MLLRVLLLATAAAAVQVHVDKDFSVGQDSADVSSQKLRLALQELWGGAELTQDGSAALSDMIWNRSLAPRQQQQYDEQAELAGKPKLVLMGPMDSGTHLMLYSLIANWPQEMQQACLSPGALEPGQEPQMCRHIWKHSLVDKEGVYRVLRKSVGDLEDAVLLILVRSPMSQVLSWKRDPWDLAPCLSRPWEEMDQPCKADLKSKPPASFAGIPTSGADTFESIADVYNRYMRLYSDLAQEGQFKAVKIVAYEEMVTSPSEILDGVATALNWAKPDTYRILDGSQKNELGTSRVDALAKIQKRTYLTRVGAEGVQRVCQGIDRKALEALPVSAGGFSKGYVRDCSPEAMKEAEAA